MKFNETIKISSCFAFTKQVSDLDDKNGIGNDVIGRALRTKHMMSIIDCKDANDNTALSEAASMT